MKILSESEKKALEIMKKENFRGISKDNVMNLVSILDRVDPEVAKSLIAQMPEVVKGIIENEKTYANCLAKGIESSDMSTSSCFQTEDEIIKTLQKEIDKEDITFDQKKYYFEKMEEAAKRKEGKDTEHKNMILTILKFGGEALLLGCSAMLCLYIGRANISTASRHRGIKDWLQ